MMVLLTGGLGYIGSHTCVELLNKNYDVAIIDNLSNSEEAVLDNIKKITNKSVKFYKGDIRDSELLDKIFKENNKENNIDSVIHFAGLKAVGESIQKPIQYYDNNIIGTLNLCKIMSKHNIRNMIFSSSATVYGSQKSPLTEDMDIMTYSTNPYGNTKIIGEQMLRDIYYSDNKWSICLLRYFNPIGAHESGLIGEKPKGIPNNIMPYITQVAMGIREILNIHGGNDTDDGTCIRDYIHVVDLAKGHVASLEKIKDSNKIEVYNLGTGLGHSVLELVSTFEEVNEVKIPNRIIGPREGDINMCYANTDKANDELKWKTEKDLKDMCRDSWNFQKRLNK